MTEKSGSLRDRPPLGLASGVVEIVPYNPAWPELFIAERDRIIGVLKEHGVTLRLEHTGSTAVPGLAAKPVLDILAGWVSEADHIDAIEAMEAAGYDYRGEQGIVGRDFFRRGEPRQYHVHLAQINSRFWRDHLTFRDYLRLDRKAAREYAELKLELARQHPCDRESYIEGKTAFVHDVINNRANSLLGRALRSRAEQWSSRVAELRSLMSGIADRDPIPSDFHRLAARVEAELSAGGPVKPSDSGTLRDDVTKLMADLEELQCELKRQEDESFDAEQKAIFAVRAGRDDLARKAIEQRIAADASAETLRRDIASLELVIEECEMLAARLSKAGH